MRELKEGLPSWADYLIDAYVAGSITYLVLGPILGGNLARAAGMGIAAGPAFATLKYNYEVSKNE
jgi:hypothetical protein